LIFFNQTYLKASIQIGLSFIAKLRVPLSQSIKTPIKELQTLTPPLILPWCVSLWKNL